MFTINYEISQEQKEALSKIEDITIFERDFSTIMGQIEFIFNDKSIGFIAREVPEAEDYLLIWMQRLTQGLVALIAGQFMAVQFPQTNEFWLEFEVNKNDVIVREVSVVEDRESSVVVRQPKVRKEIFWEETISKNNLVITLLHTTENIMKDIMKINKILCQASEFIRLEDKYREAKKYFNY